MRKVQHALSIDYYLNIQMKLGVLLLACGYPINFLVFLKEIRDRKKEELACLITYSSQNEQNSVLYN